MPTIPSREQVEQEAEALTIRAAELRDTLWQADLVEQQRQADVARRFDEQLVASYSRRNLDADVAAAHQAMRDALAASPLVQALVDYSAALVRRRIAVYEQITTQLRLNPARNNGIPDLPSAEPPSISDVIASVVQDAVAQRTEADRADLAARRANAQQENTQ